MNDFEGFSGNDTITGNGNTRISYTWSTAGVDVDLTRGTAVGDSSVGTDTFTGVKSVRGSTYYDYLVGDANSNVLDGGGGNDILNGMAGNWWARG
jgi:Ca2+-binding RTX toxin-like protein